MKISLFIRNLLYKASEYCEHIIYRNSPNFSVLCFHSFSTSGYQYSTHPDTFKKILDTLMSRGSFVDSTELVHVLSGHKNHTPQYLLTIDDGYKSVLKIAPIIRRYNIPVILFVLSDPQRAARKELGTNEELLTWEDIKKLIALGWRIGSHSETHPNFTQLSEADLKSEIIKSKKNLENRLKVCIEDFAYPRGFHNEQIVSIVRDSGYKRAYTLSSNYISKGINMFTIPRISFDKTHNESAIPGMLSRVFLLFRKYTDSLHIWEKFIYD